MFNGERREGIGATIKKLLKAGLFMATAYYLVACGVSEKPKAPVLKLSTSGPETLEQFAAGIQAVLPGCDVFPAVWDGKYTPTNEIKDGQFLAFADVRAVPDQKCYQMTNVTIPGPDIVDFETQKIFLKKEALGNALAYGWSMNAFDQRTNSMEMLGHQVSLPVYGEQLKVLADGLADQYLTPEERTIANGGIADTNTQWSGNAEDLNCAILNAVNTQRKLGRLGPLSDGRPQNIDELVKEVGCK